MSSTNKTSLGLNMWEASDKPVRQDFVNDNVIIDEKITKLNSDLALKTDKSSYFIVYGDLTENIAQTWDLPVQNGNPAFLLAAQIQLGVGAWSDLRTLTRMVQIANNSVQVALTKDAAESYVGYQVRFLFMLL
ncbi:hypothetical protein K413DRAFT_5364 [Clostridium sp. ASBs410]|nr:hypothetical protein K413DRAFT_5364 [Clostridium sp. ASBs410]